MSRERGEGILQFLLGMLHGFLIGLTSLPFKRNSFKKPMKAKSRGCE